MESYIKRIVENKIVENLKIFRCISIVGPKFCGKTEMSLKHCASSINISIDSNKKTAEIMPSSILIGSTPRLIDEWQIVPKLWDEIKVESDLRKKTGQFIISGSSAPSLASFFHSGSGRIGKIKLNTMTLFEMSNSSKTINIRSLLSEPNYKFSGSNEYSLDDYIHFMIRGGWPYLINKSEKQCSTLLKSYVDDISKVDIKELSPKINKTRVDSLIYSLSRNISTDVSLKTLSADSKNENSVSEKTILNYIDRLQEIFFLELLQQWPTHIRSSVVQRINPKFYICDVSLVMARLGISKEKAKTDFEFLGFAFEALASHDLRAYADVLDAKSFFYRDSSGLEVDLIIELDDGSWSAFEIKLYSDSLIEEGAKHLKLFKNKLLDNVQKKCISLNIVTTQKISYTRDDGINVISLCDLYIE